MFEIVQKTPYEIRFMAAGKTATIPGEPVVGPDGRWQFAVYRSDVGVWDEGTEMSEKERASILLALSDRGTRLD